MTEYFKQLRQYNLWDKDPQSLGFLRTSYTDALYRYVGNKLVKVLVGQRRSGKSFIMRQLAARLIESGVDRRNIFMLNLDIVAFDFVKTYRDLIDIFNVYVEEIKPQGRLYIFVDEIQNVDGWERFVNSYSQDFTQDYEIFITGSNSKMLAGELATLLSGRYVKFNIFPFSFDEYADVNTLPHSRETYIRYMQDGGMPELQHLASEEMRRNYTASLKDTILLRDIIQRYSIKDVRLLEDLFIYIINNTSNLFSVNSLIKYYKSLGRSVSFDKVSAYLEYLCETYLIHRTERYNIRGKETIAGVCKYYANDLSFSNYLYKGFPHGFGYNLENLQYLDLLRAGYDVYVGSIKEKEVDFVAQRGERVIYVQSTYLLAEEDTIEREYTPLENISDNYEKFVVSMDELHLPSRGGIEHVQAWEFYERIK